jgi:hypothetical protein
MSEVQEFYFQPLRAIQARSLPVTLEDLSSAYLACKQRYASSKASLAELEKLHTTNLTHYDIECRAQVGLARKKALASIPKTPDRGSTATVGAFVDSHVAPFVAAVLGWKGSNNGGVDKEKVNARKLIEKRCRDVWKKAPGGGEVAGVKRKNEESAYVLSDDDSGMMMDDAASVEVVAPKPRKTVKPKKKAQPAAALVAVAREATTDKQEAAKPAAKKRRKSKAEVQAASQAPAAAASASGGKKKMSALEEARLAASADIDARVTAAVLSGRGKKTGKPPKKK